MILFWYCVDVLMHDVINGLEVEGERRKENVCAEHDFKFDTMPDEMIEICHYNKLSKLNTT